MSYLELPTTMNYLFQHQKTLLSSAVLEVHTHARTHARARAHARTCAREST